jgi:hypothetical protein
MIFAKLLNKNGVDMKVYTVYRVANLNNTSEAVGKLVERRRGERHNNTADMLKLAQKVYGKSSIGSNLIIIREDFSPRAH